MTLSTLTLYELTCLMCGEIVGRTTDPRTYQPTTSRCPRCGGRIQCRACLEDPREFGLVPLPQLFPVASSSSCSGGKTLTWC